MQALPPCRVVCVQSEDAPGEDLVDRVLSLPGFAPHSVEVVSDASRAYALVEASRDAAPFIPLLLVHPSCRDRWLEDDCLSGLWDRDPAIQVVVCDWGASVLRHADTPERQGQLFHLGLGAPDPGDPVLALLVSNALLLRHLKLAEAVAGEERSRLEELRGQLRLAGDTIARISRRLEDTSASRQFLASHDPLTELPNRGRLNERLRDELDRTRREPNYQFTVLLLNLNRFKVINESFGQRHGDQLLVEVSRRLTNAVRGTDMVCRIGADEFAIVLEETPQLADVQRVAHRLLHSPASHLRIEGRGLPVSAALGGVVVSAGCYEGPDDLLRDASFALARAKARGGSRIEFFHPAEHNEDRQQLELETFILHALEQEEFSLNYQPIIALPGRTIAGFEALLRWRHPAMGYISPARFIPIAEQNGLIDPLGEWILRRGCRDLREMQRATDNASLFLTVNISNRQLFRSTFAATALKIISAAEIDPRRLCFELTETTMIDDFEVVIENLTTLKAAGIRIFIDDFGVGYSSLHSLHRLPADSLKIDRAFITAISSSPKGEAIVRSIVEMGHTLELTLVAEGIEEEDELRRVAGMRCDYAQGFYFSRGVEQAVALQMLREGRTF